MSHSKYNNFKHTQRNILILFAMNSTHQTAQDAKRMEWFDHVCVEKSYDACSQLLDYQTCLSPPHSLILQPVKLSYGLISLKGCSWAGRKTYGEPRSGRNCRSARPSGNMH